MQEKDIFSIHNKREILPDQGVKQRLYEVFKFSVDNLRIFVAQDKNEAAVLEHLELADLEILSALPQEVSIIKNKYGIFSWKGDEEGVRLPFHLGTDLAGEFY